MSKFIQPEFFKYSDDYYPVNILEDYPNCSNKGKQYAPNSKAIRFDEIFNTYLFK